MSSTPFAVVLGLEDGSSLADLEPSNLVEVLTRRVRTAERAGFTAVTFDDAALAGAGRYASIDAVQRAAFVAPLTGAIGLIPLTHPAYAEPFHVATQLASLDWASRGRAGWWPVAASDPREADAAGEDPLTDAELARERDDAIEVSRRLWDSWEDDAVITDVATGRYLDADRLHYVDFVGARYTVKGPLITPRPPQGQPLVIGEEGTSGVDVVLVDAVHLDRGARREGGAPLVWALLRATVSPAGGAEALVQTLVDLSRVVDGVHLVVEDTDLDAGIDLVGRSVLPAFDRSSGGIRRAVPRPGETLRNALGLERSVSRYAQKEIA